MKKDNNSTECCQDRMSYKSHHCHGGGQSNAVYGLGLIGALFYFLNGASTFSLVIIGVGKAIVWPALLIFKLLTYLKL